MERGPITNHTRTLSRLRHVLGLQGRRVRVRLGGVWDSERDTLRALLPASVLKFFSNRSLVCRYSSSRIAFFVAENSHLEHVTEAPASAVSGTAMEEFFRDEISPIRSHCDLKLLELGADILVCVQAIFPLATERDIDQVLGFEMNRLTPFQSNQVYYDYTLRRRDPDTGKLHVNLYFIPRERLTQILTWCERIGVTPDQIRRVEGDGESRPIRLIPRDRTWMVAIRMVNPALFGLAIVLAIALVAVPLLTQRHTLNEMRAELESLREQSTDVMRIREEFQQRLEVPKNLVQSQLKRRTVVESLSELTEVVPKHTWLRSVRINGEHVTIEGASQRATSLPAIIEQSAAFSSARFDAPIAASRRSNGDAFTISAEIASRDVL